MAKKLSRKKLKNLVSEVSKDTDLTDLLDMRTSTTNYQPIFEAPLQKASKQLPGKEVIALADGLQALLIETLLAYELNTGTTPTHQPPQEDGYGTLFSAMVNVGGLLPAGDQAGFYERLQSVTRRDAGYQGREAMYQLVPAFVTGILAPHIDKLNPNMINEAMDCLEDHATRETPTNQDDVGTIYQIWGNCKIDRHTIGEYARRGDPAQFIDDFDVAGFGKIRVGANALHVHTGHNGREVVHPVLYRDAGGLPSREVTYLMDVQAELQRRKELREAS